MNDALERITIYHDKEVGMLAQRAESLTINKASINDTHTQEIPGQAIDAVTGHVPGADPADNLAVFRAFGPDQPDPPHGNGGGGGGGSGGGGRGVPPPGPRGAGHEVPLPPHTDSNCMAKALTSLQETNGRPDDTPATPLACRCLKSRILQSIPTTKLTPYTLAAHTESAHRQMQHVWAQQPKQYERLSTRQHTDI